MPRKFVAFGLVLFSTAAQADTDFIKGVYLQTEELCAQAKKDSLQTVLEAGNTMLSSRGIESIEYNCEFVQVTKATPSAIVSRSVRSWACLITAVSAWASS